MIKVSIIMPSFNSGKFIEKSIDSVLNQSYSDWELIIIDDCSFDNSLKIIEEYKDKDNRIRLIKNEVNSGVANARNLGISFAKGFYLAFLDSDDIWDSKKLEMQVNFMELNKASISFTQYFRIDEHENRLREVSNIPEIVNYHDLLKGNSIAMSTSMIKSEIIGDNFFEKIGHEDYYFWLKILRVGNIAHGLKKNLAFYRVHQSSLSSNKLKAVKYTWYIYKSKLGLNLLQTIYYFFIHESKAVIKRII